MTSFVAGRTQIACGKRTERFSLHIEDIALILMLQSATNPWNVIGTVQAQQLIQPFLNLVSRHTSRQLKF